MSVLCWSLLIHLKVCVWQRVSIEPLPLQLLRPASLQNGTWCQTLFFLCLAYRLSSWRDISLSCDLVCHVHTRAIFYLSCPLCWHWLPSCPVTCFVNVEVRNLVQFVWLFGKVLWEIVSFELERAWCKGGSGIPPYSLLVGNSKEQQRKDSSARKANKKGSSLRISSTFLGCCFQIILLIHLPLDNIHCLWNTILKCNPYNE